MLPGCEIRSRAVCTASIIFSARAMDFAVDAWRDFDAVSSVLSTEMDCTWTELHFESGFLKNIKNSQS